MENKEVCSRIVQEVAVAVPSSKSIDEESGKRRHSTPSCGTGHLLRQSADLPIEDDVRCRRSGSAVPRRVNRQTTDDPGRTAALPAWAKAVRSSHVSLQGRSSGMGDGDRSQSTTNDIRSSAASALQRRELLQTNFSVEERRDRVRSESQISSDPSSPPQVTPAAGQARPPQQRRSSIAVLPLSEGSASLFSQKSAGPHLATKDRISLGFGNASDLVASLIGSRSSDPSPGETEDHFWVPPTIWKKTRAQSLVPQKLSIDTKAVPGKSIY